MTSDGGYPYATQDSFGPLLDSYRCTAASTAAGAELLRWRRVWMRLRPTGRDSELVEVDQPTRCPNGHRLGPRTVIVGFLPCYCAGGAGHRTYACRECDQTIYVPEHDRTVLPPPR